MKSVLEAGAVGERVGRSTGNIIGLQNLRWNPLQLEFLAGSCESSASGGALDAQQKDADAAKLSKGSKLTGCRFQNPGLSLGLSGPPKIAKKRNRFTVFFPIVVVDACPRSLGVSQHTSGCPLEKENLEGNIYTNCRNKTKIKQF